MGKDAPHASLYDWRMALSLAVRDRIVGPWFASTKATWADDFLGILSEAGAVAQEALSALRTVAAFGGERAELKRYDKALVKAEQSGVDTGFYGGFGVGCLFLTMFSMYAVGLYWGARLVLMSRDADPLCAYDPNREGCFTGGVVLNVVFALLIGGGAMGQAGPSLQVIGTAMGGAVKIFETLDRVSAIDTAEDAPGLRPAAGAARGEIEFRDVTFAYPSRPEQPVLRNFSLKIAAGESVALVGVGKLSSQGLRCLRLGRSRKCSRRRWPALLKKVVARRGKCECE
jgi:ATP-binding cassette subfamily B (MDR/TAP) protein 1